MEQSQPTMNISEILWRLSTMEKNARYNTGPAGSIGAKNAEALHLALTIVDLAATEALIPMTPTPPDIKIQVASTQQPTREEINTALKAANFNPRQG